MTVKFNDVNSSIKKPLKKNGHTQAKSPIIDINQPGRLRVSNLLALFNISHSTLYVGIKTGRYPKPDGRDGSIPYWRTETICMFLNKEYS